MSFAGKFSFPERYRWIPYGWDVFLHTRAVTAWATPAGPRFGLDHWSSGGEQFAQQHGEDNISIHEVQDSF
jgi:hypothetical protein